MKPRLENRHIYMPIANMPVRSDAPQAALLQVLARHFYFARHTPRTHRHI